MPSHHASLDCFLLKSNPNLSLYRLSISIVFMLLFAFILGKSLNTQLLSILVMQKCCDSLIMLLNFVNLQSSFPDFEVWECRKINCVTIMYIYVLIVIDVFIYLFIPKSKVYCKTALRPLTALYFRKLYSLSMHFLVRFCTNAE